MLESSAVSTRAVERMILGSSSLQSATPTMLTSILYCELPSKNVLKISLACETEIYSGFVLA
jgi:hypothetical protein